MLVAPAVTWVWQEEDHQKNYMISHIGPCRPKKHQKEYEDNDPVTSSETLGRFTGGPVSVLTAPMPNWGLARWAAMARFMHDIKK